MRVLAVDIGTNSSLFLIADVAPGEVTVLETGIVGNGLGAEIGADGRLSIELIEKNQLILKQFFELGQSSNCRKFAAAGTHALRRATNPEDFRAMAAKVGVPLRIISGEAEARMAWRGVFASGRDDQTALAGTEVALLDIGGGSSELSRGSVQQPTWSSSLPTGAVMVTREFFRHDPPLPEDVQAADDYLTELLAPWRNAISKHTRLIGIAGTIVTLTAMTHGLTKFKTGFIEGKKLTRADVALWRERLLTLNLSQRHALPAMSPARADSIHAGTMILQHILDLLQIEELYASEKGLLFGLALELGEAPHRNRE